MATSPVSVRPLTLALLMLLLLSGVGCGDEGGSSVSVSEALADRGVDLDALFAAPTMSELETMRRDWGTRDTGADSVQLEAEFALEGGDTLRIVLHRVDGQRHYGAVIIPPGEHLSGSLPVAVSLIGFGIEMVLEVPDDARAFDDRYVTVLPSFRGHELRFGDETWVSEGDSFDQCDGGSDDALAFLEAALSTTPSARASDILALGGSRGGNVALLLGIRNFDIAAVVNVAGPTDYLRQELLDHPNMTALYANYFVRGLLEGTGDERDARQRMLACSPVHFAEDLPPTQAHHGTEDLNVPFSQAELLASRMTELGRAPPMFQLFAYQGADHQLENQQGVIADRIGVFLDGLDLD